MGVKGHCPEGPGVVESRDPGESPQVPPGGPMATERVHDTAPRTTVHRSGSAIRWLPFRTPTHGPELELVHEYLESHIPPPPDGQALTVFLEPAIESGFPDLVAVYWSQRVASFWAACRAELTGSDVRVAHFLATRGASDVDTLEYYFRPRVSCALERLHAANMIRRVGSRWRARPLETIFAVRRLLAIEAKVTNLREGLLQAIQNTWFASESYLLLPKLPRGSALSDEAEKFGVGVAERGRPLHRSGVRPRRKRIPLSYASWLFNEWAWRSACSGR